MNLIDGDKLKYEAETCLETTDGFKDLIDQQPVGRSFILNPNRNILTRVVQMIIDNDGHCPCQVEKSDDTLCPCVDFYKGQCHCNLFVDKE